jgi:hypothetical protein
LISRDIYIKPILENAPRLLGLLNRNISSEGYGCFDRDFWHYNTVDIACARKQEAVLTLTLLYLIKHEDNKYYRSKEILCYIRAAMLFWTRIQNKNGSFNEWYPNEHSFVVTSFSTYAVSESLLHLKDEILQDEYSTVVRALIKAGNWLISRNEPRVMNQQTGAAVSLLNLYLITNESKYLDSSRDKISLLNQRQSEEGWFIEYGGPDIGYLSLAIDYLCKYYDKTKDEQVKKIVDHSLSFITYFIQPNLVAGGEYTSRNTEYLIPSGFEAASKTNKDAFFAASVVRKALLTTNSFPHLLDDRYLTYNGYTWLQAYFNANRDIDETVEDNITSHFNKSFTKYFEESGLLIINNDQKHIVINVKKGGAFRLFDKKTGRTYSDSGILVKSNGKWYTSGWLAETDNNISNDVITVSGNMWKVPDKTINTVRYVALRLFQMTLGLSSFISLWMKERLRDILITKTEPSDIRYKRTLSFKSGSGELLKIKDSVSSKKPLISSIAVFSKDTHIYVPSSRYYTGMKGPHFQKTFSHQLDHIEISWKIGEDSEMEFEVEQ